VDKVRVEVMFEFDKLLRAMTQAELVEGRAIIEKRLAGRAAVPRRGRRKGYTIFRQGESPSVCEELGRGD